jgi:hypothetical protein
MSLRIRRNRNQHHKKPLRLNRKIAATGHVKALSGHRATRAA